MSPKDPQNRSDTYVLSGSRHEIQITPDESIHQRSQVKNTLDRLGLEEIVQIAHKVGLEYVHISKKQKDLSC